jgi:hypothetical protein
VSVELATGTFEGRVGEAFTATPSLGGEPIELTLSRCVDSPYARPDHPAFSLFFNAPEPPPQPQQVFAVRHAELGEFDLFLVPVGPQEYEAVVN